MRFGRAILSFALALLWLGMPVHCGLEVVSTASVFACADDADCSSPADKGCEDDFCDSLESGNYFPQKSFSLTKAPAALLAVEVFYHEPLVVVLQERSSLVAADEVPFLATSWQFVQRVAAPPRAPSFVS